MFYISETPPHHSTIQHYISSKTLGNLAYIILLLRVAGADVGSDDDYSGQWR